MPTTVIEAEWRASFPAPVDERLLLDGEGRVWLWSLRPEGAARAHRAGTYAALVPGDLVERAVAAFDAAATATGHDSGRGGRCSAWRDDRLVRVAPGSELEAALTALRAAADGGPVAVVSVGWQPLGTLRSGAAATLFFVLRAEGTEPVTLAVDAGSFTLVASRGGAPWAPLWSPPPGAPLEVVTPMGEILGTEIRPAVIPPGTQASVPFPDALDPGPPGTIEVSARVDGRIALAGPVPGRLGPPAPTDAFSIASAPVALAVLEG